MPPNGLRGVRKVRPARPSPRSPRQEPSPSVVHTRPKPSGAPRGLYDPQELEEPDVDLDEDRRRTILDTFYRLDSLDFYDLLGVETDAPKSEVRSAYFRLSKVFHPDTMFGKNLGSYKSKMEAVFKRLTEAYEVLGKKRSRAEYDNYILLKRRTRDAQKSVDRASREAERIERETARSAGDGDKAEAGPGKRAPAPAARSDRPNQGLDQTPDEGRRVESTSVFPTAPEDAPATGSRPRAPSAPPSSVFERPAPVTRTMGSAPLTSDPKHATEMTAEGKARARELMARKLAAAAGRSLPGTGRIARVPLQGPARGDSTGSTDGE